MEKHLKPIFMLLLASPLVAIVIVTAVTQNISTDNRSKAATSQSVFIAQPFVAVSQTSPETTVASKVVAEKINLERKVISPKSAAEVAAIKAAIEAQGGSIIESDANSIVAEIPQEKEAELSQNLLTSGSINAMEVDYPVFVTADTPDWGINRIQAPLVWEKSTGSGVRIGIVDTGIDYRHPDLAARYAGGIDAVNNDTDPYDDNGHGTHVAGTVAADLNGTGLAGGSPQASLYGLKVMAADGSGYVSDLIDAIDWAMANNLHLLNFSLGTTYDSSILKSKLDEASRKGIILVAAAGNTGGGPLMYPAAYGTVISVAATDQNNNLASFSSIGAELAAPGVAIKSTVPGGGYATWSGTSMASPHVTATAALMLGNGITNIREALHNTSVDLGPVGTDGYYGFGLIDAKSSTLGEDTLSPIVTFVKPENGSVASGTVSIELNIQDEHTIKEATVSANNRVLTRWTQGPYTYEWDTAAESLGDYQLIAGAVDDSGNVGEVKITITLGQIADPTPTASVSAKGKSTEHRKGRVKQTNEETVAEPTSTQTPEPQIPEVTNVNERNQKPEEPTPAVAETQSTDSAPGNSGNAPGQQEDKDQGRGKVKGISTDDHWLWRLVDWFI